MLDAALVRFPDQASWSGYAAHVRERIQEGAGLRPWPRRTPLNAISNKPRVRKGYSVENVAFEAIPNYYVTGNLYRPLDPPAPFAVVLSLHGHANYGQVEAQQMRTTPSVQQRSATLARMGAVVLAVDMFAFGDSLVQVGREAHAKPFTMTIQTWSNMRALDYLLSLEGADPTRVGVTGESGGGTQAILLAALDPRVTVSVPVSMVSSYFFGGCKCESGLPIHRSADHFVSNVMIAALFAPKPMLVISNGTDWTQHTPEIELPFLRRIYGYWGAEGDVVNVHLPEEDHDYGPSKRGAMYEFMAERLGLNLEAMGIFSVDELSVAIAAPATLAVFDHVTPLPPNALRDAADVERSLRALQN